MKKTALFILFFLSMAGISLAQTFNVGTLGELQTALTTAEGNNQDDIINIAAGTINFGSPLSYNSDQGNSLTIIGAGSGATVLNAVGSYQILYIYDYSASPVPIIIEGITFQNASSDGSNDGAGLFLQNDNGGVTLTDCAFRNNQTEGYGGGAYIESAAGISISGCSFIGNACGGDGGGLYAHSYGTITIVNSVFRNNMTTAGGDYGGGLYIYAENETGDVYFINNTITGNTSPDQGGGLCLDDSNDAKTFNIYNNIIWGNTSTSAPGTNDMFVFNSEATVINLFNNDIGPYELDDSAGTLNPGSNINTDPLINGTSHLTSDSPCINVGTNSAPQLPSRDFEGDNRVMGGTVDMGADEYLASSSASIPTMNEWGMILFMAVLGLGAFYYLKRQNAGMC